MRLDQITDSPLEFLDKIDAQLQHLARHWQGVTVQMRPVAREMGLLRIRSIKVTLAQIKQAIELSVTKMDADS